MEEILTELRNIKLKFAQLTEEADSIIHKVKLYQESIPMDAVVMPNEVLAGLRGREYNIVRSALNRQQKYLEAFVKEYKTETNTPVTYGTVKEEIEIIKALLKWKPAWGITYMQLIRLRHRKIFRVIEIINNITKQKIAKPYKQFVIELRVMRF